MAATFESQVAELTKKGATLAESVDAITKFLNEPQYGGVMPHAGNGALGYWDSKAPVLKTKVRMDGSYRPLPVTRMPDGYRRASHDAFKSGSQFYREGLRENALFNQKHASIIKAIQGMTTQVGSDGGQWVLPEFSQTIIDRIYKNDLWQRTDGYTVAGNNLTFKANAETSRADGSRHGGLRGYWVEEGQTITKSKPTTRDVTLKLSKVAVVVYLTDELIDDAGPALEQYVNGKAAQEFEFLLGAAVVRGNGAGQPLGMVNAGALLAIAKETGQAATTLVTENIDKMFARRIANEDYVWLANQDCHPQLSLLSQAVGVGGSVIYRHRAAWLMRPMRRSRASRSLILSSIRRSARRGTFCWPISGSTSRSAKAASSRPLQCTLNSSPTSWLCGSRCAWTVGPAGFPQSPRIKEATRRRSSWPALPVKHTDRE